MWRNVIVNKESKLKIHNESLEVISDVKHTISLEDISMLMLNNNKIELNAHVIYKLSEYNICTVFIDDKYMPISTLQGINGHSRASNVLERQIEVSKVVKNNLWKKTIERKIHNQSLCLEELEKPYKIVRNISYNVKSNDSNNRESYAAREYFKLLFDNEHTRRSENLINSALNYCYAIVRSNIARYCIGYGLNTQIGIFHKNDLNAFNLVDDLIEVFRPIVDLFVIEALNKKSHVSLSTCLKNELLYINVINVRYNGKKYSMDKCIELYVANFKRCIIENSCEIFTTPELISLEIHKYE